MSPDPRPFPEPPPIESVPNLRDVGGLPTRDGRWVRTGVLYRSGALQRLDGDDMAAFERLGIRLVYDLRGARERAVAPDHLPPGVAYVGGDVLADWTEGAPDRVFGWFDDPAAARRGLGDGRGEALWIDQYRRFVTLPSAHAVYGRLFREIARPDRRPVLVHCSGGKDRSGWAAASLLLLLGVAEGDVLADYRRSGWHDDDRAAAMMAALAERGGDPALWRPIFAAEPRYLAAAIEQVRVSYGSIEAWFADGLGIDRAAQDGLRGVFLGEPATAPWRRDRQWAGDSPKARLNARLKAASDE
jgi:protein-tyrosine phosphatase